VMQDRLDPADARSLARPGLGLLDARARVLDDPAWADLADPSDDGRAEPPGAPLEEDWAAADAGSTVEGYVPPGTRTMRRGFFGVVGVVGVVAALGYGFVAQELPASLLWAGAVAALCWTFATWSPRRR
jgi:hypothetical protein